MVAASMPKLKIDYSHKNPYLFKIDPQMWKLHRELNLPDIFIGIYSYLDPCLSDLPNVLKHIFTGKQI